MICNVAMHVTFKLILHTINIYNKVCFIKPGAPGFLKSFCLHISRCVCLSVCLPPRELIISGMIWCDTGYVWLVKPVLQFFKILLSINWKGVALVTQRIMHARQRCWSLRRTSHRRRCINYLRSSSNKTEHFDLIKVSGRMRSNEFKRKLGFSFTVTI